jgi:hypothetical protein
MMVPFVVLFMSRAFFGRVASASHVGRVGLQP